MQDGIKLLIDRMEHHPEEFFGDLSYRWSNIMQDIAKHGPEFLEEDDLLLLNKKVKEVRRKELNAKIMDEIATQERLITAQERLNKAGKIDTFTTSIGGSLAPQYPVKPKRENVWWSTDNDPHSWPTDDNTHSYFKGSIVGNMIERGQDNATLQNIRATNHQLEEELRMVKMASARRDEERAKAQAYKKRSNQNWK
jgi:hypothetical protein